MDINEYNAWIEETRRSNFNWNMDEVAKENRGEYFFYIGGESGRFIRIDGTGKMDLGTYEEAVPHIGDALFRVEASKQYASQAEALNRAIQNGGMSFLMDFLGYRCYTTHIKGVNC